MIKNLVLRRRVALTLTFLLLVIVAAPSAVGMDTVRDYIGVTAAHALGFDGTGVIGAVSDNGLDQGHPDLVGQVLAEFGNPPDAAHGTCTFGILFSSGIANSTARGMLPGSGGVFIDWSTNRLASTVFINSLGGSFICLAWAQGVYTGEYDSHSVTNDACVLFYDITHVWPVAMRGDLGQHSIAVDAVAKNVIAVGGVYHNNTPEREDDQFQEHPNLGTPGYGPAKDGRVKPDLCGPFEFIYTTDSRDGIGESNGYREGDYVYTNADGKFGGTEATAAVVAGAVGIIYQMYQENFFGNNSVGATPHAATVKALLINDAYQYDFSQATRFQQGWGLPDLQRTIDIAEKRFIVDEEIALLTGESSVYSFTPEENCTLKVTLVWTDPPAMQGANPALVNNLDLKVTAPDATVYWGNNGLETAKWSSPDGLPDNLNNVENVFIETPQPGQWTIEVIGANVVEDAFFSTPEIDQAFALVATTKKPYICGDANGDGDVNVSDAVYIINYVFVGGDPPDPMESGDANCDTVCNVSDAVWIINYVFVGGNDPCDTDGDGEPDC